MKKLFSFFFCLLIVQAAFSQCYTDTVMERYKRAHPRWEKSHINAVDWWRQQPQPQLRAVSGVYGAGVLNPIIYNIPVVVH